MKDFVRRTVIALVIGLVVFAVFAYLVVRRDGLVARCMDPHIHGVTGISTAQAMTAHWPILETWDQSAFDYWFKSFRMPGRFDDVVALHVDNETQRLLSTERLFGRWPWSRAAWEMILDFVARGGPKAIIFDVFFHEPNMHDPEGLSEFPVGSKRMVGAGDLVFADAIAAAGKVYLPYRLLPMGNTSGGCLSEDESIFLESVKPTWSTSTSAFAANRAVVRRGPVNDEPLDVLRMGVCGYGWVDSEIDPDSGMRRTALVFRHAEKQGRLYPGLALAAVMNAEPGIFSVDAEGRVLRKGRPLPMGQADRYVINHTGAFFERYPHIPLGEVIVSQRVIDGSLPLADYVADGGTEAALIRPERFKDKYVIIGTSITAAHDIKQTPFGADEPGMVKHMAIIEGLLTGTFVTRVDQRTLLLVVLCMCVGGALSFQLAGSPFRGTIIYVMVAIAYYILAAQLFAVYRYQLDAFGPQFALLATFLVTVTWNYFVEDRKRREVRSMFSKYMSPEIVSMLETDPDLIKPGGDRRVLTAFFSDLANFTTLSETLDPEELLELINEYLELMTAEIIAHGGYLDKFQGDGIMAVFGVYPGEGCEQRGNHALEACRAALANQRDIIGLRKRWEEDGKPPVAVRIGINSGPMIAGNVGYEGKLNYTVLGDAVNLASRLEGANKVFGTLVMLGEQTYDLVKDDVLVRELDLLAVKGKRQGIRVYELLGIKGEDVLTEQQYGVLDCFQNGLVAFRRQRWSEAVQQFEQGLAIVPDDGPCRTYVERCAYFELNPPGQDWDGVFRLKTK